MDTLSIRTDSPEVTREHREQRLHVCLEGFVYLGHLVRDEETGEEAEVIDRIPCRRCQVAADTEDL